MAIYEVFSRPVLIRYKATICSNTTLFYIIITLIKFIGPFFLTYYSQGFWRKIDFYQEQPDVSFKHNMFIILETKVPDQLVFWSTYENMNGLMAKKYLQALPEIEHREEDYNRDGKKDELQMTIDIPLDTQEVMAVKIILIFEYHLQLYSDFYMESAAYIHHSSSLPGAELRVVGDLALFQREALKHSGKDERFNVPVISESDSFISLETIIQNYASRNITTTFTNFYPLWKTPRTEGESFLINIAVKYPTETILYRVGFWQLFKWALVQYISIFIVLSVLIHKINKCIFENQNVPTVVMNPLHKKIM